VIEFPCTCGHRFRLEDDQAGTLIQCPQCRRLNDIPAHGELSQFLGDGTYKVDDPVDLRDSNEVAAELAYVYQRGHHDADGNEIDLRLNRADIESIGGDPIPLAPDAPPRQAPRYDPETGELITAHELKDELAPKVDPASIPMAKAAINYATGETVHHNSFLRALAHLFSPLNVAVTFSVFMVHVLLWPLLLVMYAGILYLILAVPVLVGMILAHYGNVIEDVGPFERDELPRPLRNVGWHEDIWSPFCNFFGSLAICYGPSAVLPLLVVRVPAFQPMAAAIGVLCGAMGTFFFPAVLLTLQTSGSSFNLRPDRVLALIGSCGAAYFFAVVLWTVTAAIYLWGFIGTSLALATVMHSSNLPAWLTSWSITVPALVAGIFLMHYFCMCLGILYRLHYPSFQWVLQRHIPKKKTEPAESAALLRRIRPVKPVRSLPRDRRLR
jgi:hypothetical protein